MTVSQILLRPPHSAVLTKGCKTKFNAQATGIGKTGPTESRHRDVQGPQPAPATGRFLRHCSACCTSLQTHAQFITHQTPCLGKSGI